METLYLICLIVGGFFVALSLWGGADHDTAGGHDAAPGHDAAGHDAVHDGAGPGWTDLFTLRTLFLFAAFFGLTGSLLSWTGTAGLVTGLLSVLVGLAVGFGGSYAIRQVGYARVSSNVERDDLCGRTARVTIPFEGGEKGKITLEAKGQRMQLVARALDEETPEPFRPGDEVVVVRFSGTVAEVVKPA